MEIQTESDLEPCCLCILTPRHNKVNNMNNKSQETLRRVAQNDPSLTELTLSGNSLYDNDNFNNCGAFYSYSSDDYSTLGSAIANNTHLENLIVTLSEDHLPIGRGFYDDLSVILRFMNWRCIATIEI